MDDNVRDGASDRRRAGDTCINRRSLNRSVSLVYRWTVHLAAGVDYDGLATNDEQLRKNIREYSDQINKVKSTMGLNKAAREEADNDGNFATYLANLKARAKLFGVHRERQLTKALSLVIVGAYDRSDPKHSWVRGLSGLDWAASRWT